MSFGMMGGLGGPGSSAGRFSTTRGRIQNSAQNGVNYPSPFFDIAHTYLPATVKQMFRWCRYYFLTNPLINATCFKLSEYPITELLIDHPNPKIRQRWEEFFNDHLRFRPFQIECGLDYHVYGNSMVSLGFPFHKFLKCQFCSFSEKASKIRAHWTFTNFAFRLNCPGCGSTSEAIPKDFYYKDAGGIRPIRWNCENVEVNYNELSGECTYFYTVPANIRNDVMIGKKDVVEGVPQVFIQAMRERKGVVFAKDNFFHMKRPTLAQQDRGWGIPVALPVLKDVFYLQLMKKAQEQILVEHIVPLRILFPQAGSSTSDPYTSINLIDWKEHVSAEIARWRLDQNYIPILPLPIGNQTLGGDGKSLLMTQEMQEISVQIMAGLGVPREFIQGGLSYSGSNVSMRMLENQFLGYIQRQQQMATWIMKRVASYMSWPEVGLRFRPFKMADDIQRKAYLFQLNQANKISDSTLLADVDLDQSKEDETMLGETSRRLNATKRQQLAMAEIQGEAQVIMAKSQAKAQQTMATAQASGAAPGEPGDAMAGMGSPLNLGQSAGAAPAPGGQPAANMDIQQMAQMLSQQILALPPQDQELALSNLKAQSPELAQLVEQLVAQQQMPADPSMGMGAQGAAATTVNQQPLPEARAPRRAAATV